MKRKYLIILSAFLILLITLSAIFYFSLSNNKVSKPKEEAKKWSKVPLEIWINSTLEGLKLIQVINARNNYTSTVYNISSSLSLVQFDKDKLEPGEVISYLWSNVVNGQTYKEVIIDWSNCFVYGYIEEDKE